jgi:hypothetical protein
MGRAGGFCGPRLGFEKLEFAGVETPGGGGVATNWGWGWVCGCGWTWKCEDTGMECGLSE